MKRPKSKLFRKQIRLSEEEEINLLNSWIEAQKPDSGSNPLALPPLPASAKVGRLEPSSGGGGKAAESSFSRFSGVTKFDELPISQKTKDGLRDSEYFEMTKIQRATLPHALCGRDIRGGAKTGSGKTLCFIVPVLERLYRERFTPEFGVGSIIMSPTRELADQIFEVLKSVGRYHCFSAGLLIGGKKDFVHQKEHVNDMNILVCTPGRLLQHMNVTEHFDCSQLKVLVLDEADRILDVGFKKDLNAIFSELPRKRQTFLCSATQTKSVQALERVSLRDPEYISVDEESKTATPEDLQQIAMIVQPEEKMDMLWSFIKSHLNSKTLVFLSTRKQVIFVYEALKKLRPGIPLKCLHGKMKQIKRMGIYTQFCEEKRSILFCTDVGSRGLDFNRAVKWVVQVDCPEDANAYIHRVGRTARFGSGGRSLLFLMPSEMEMLKKLEAQKISLQITKANTKRLQPISGLLAALLVKYPDLQYKAQKSLITYLKSVHKNKDKEIFDVTKIPIDQLSASLGLPMTPKIRFLNQKTNANKTSQKPPSPEPESSIKEEDFRITEEEHGIDDFEGERTNKISLLGEGTTDDEGPEGKLVKVIPATRVLKKKKLKINIHRPIGTRVVFDEEGHEVPPLARIADTTNGGDKVLLDQDKKQDFYRKMKEQMKQADKGDKLQDRDRRREMRTKEKMKRQRNLMEEEEEDHDEEDDLPKEELRQNKKTKIIYDSEEENMGKADEISISDLEALALKLLSRQNQS